MNNNFNFLDFEQILKEADVQFARSSGAGGQNVNKVETKVELIFNIPKSKFLSDEIKAKILQRLHSKIDQEGNLHIIAQEERSQHANRERAHKKFITILKQALKDPKKRTKTKPTKSSQEKRLSSKKIHSLKKKFRSSDF